MRGRDDPATVDDGAAAAEPAVEGDDDLPGPRVRHRLLAPEHVHDGARPDAVDWRGTWRSRGLPRETVADPNTRLDRGHATRGWGIGIDSLIVYFLNYTNHAYKLCMTIIMVR